MSLHKISMIAALTIWSELEQARAEINKFGGSVAEIYAYRLMPYSPNIMHPGTNLEGEARLEMQSIAAEAMRDLCKLFEQERHCSVDMNAQRRFVGDRMSPDEWYAIESGLFEHRVHVQVIPKD